MVIKVGDTREIELLDSIKNADAINFKIGDKYAELTTDINKTNGSPQLKFIKDVAIIEDALILNLNSTSFSSGIWADSSSSVNDFTLYNFSEDSYTDDGLIFDGIDDYGECIGGVNLGDGDFSIESYFKKATSSYQAYNTVIGKGLYSGVGQWHLYQYDNSSVVWNFYCDKSKHLIFSADANEKLCHIVLGRKNDDMFVFINGVESSFSLDEVSGNNVDLTNSQNMTIGARANGASGFFDGTIYISRIYNRALSASEIEQNYNALNNEYYIREYFTAEQGLTLNLNAEDLSNGETTWVDRSGNGNDFTLHNFAYTTTSGYNSTEKSLIADGSNDYCLGTTGIDFGTGDFTIEIYFKKTNSTVYRYDTLISKGTYERTSHWYIYQNSTNINEWAFRSKSSDFKFYTDAVGKYCHIVIGRENDIMFARINGEEVVSHEDEMSGNNLNLTNGENLALFSRQEGQERYFQGGIKIVRFYNKALTLDESVLNYAEILHNEEV